MTERTKLRNIRRNKKLKSGTKVVFRNKYNEMQKGIVTGFDECKVVGKLIQLKCKPFNNNFINCIIPIGCRVNVLTEEEFIKRPWVK